MDRRLDVYAAHERYEEKYSNAVREAVDKAYTTARIALEAAGLCCDNADPAEELVGAIMIYVEKSNPNLETAEDELLAIADQKHEAQMMDLTPDDELR